MYRVAKIGVRQEKAHKLDSYTSFATPAKSGRTSAEKCGQHEEVTQNSTVSDARLGGRFGYFLFFLLGGGGVRGARGAGGCRSFIENPRRGEGLPGEGGGGRRAGRVSAGNSGGGGAKYLFRGRNSHQEEYPCTQDSKSITGQTCIVEKQLIRSLTGKYHPCDNDAAVVCTYQSGSLSDMQLQFSALEEVFSLWSWLAQFLEFAAVPCNRQSIHYSIFLSKNLFGITLHSLYR